jgi:hypothetical protein
MKALGALIAWLDHRRLEKGRVEDEALLLKRLLTRRFEPLAPEIEQRLAKASCTGLERWVENILDASTLDGVFRI